MSLLKALSTLRRSARGATLATALVMLLGAGVLGGALDVRVGHALSVFARGDSALRIVLTARQWWWEARYDDRHGGALETANEVHVPIGEPVLIELRSADVHQTFSVPGLLSQRQLSPGYARSFWITAEQPGLYQSDCGAPCQSGQMSLLIVAEPREEFDRWYATQLLPAKEPEDELATLGRRVFRESGCGGCHALRTLDGPSDADEIIGVGPDLTHLASRRNIATRTLRDPSEPLGAWILEPHTVKPSVRMPHTDFSIRELDGLLAYLAGLE
jgi:cytochrome c oxidase subunit 2